MNDNFLKVGRRKIHQMKRLERVWDDIRNDDKPEKGARMTRALAIKARCHTRMSIMLEIMMESGYEA